MIALGQQAKRLLIFELAQAHCALQRPLPDLEILHGRVQEHRKCLNQGDIESMRAVSDVPGGGEVDGAGAAAPRALANVDGKQAHEEEGQDEDYNNDGHGWVKISGDAVGIVRRHGTGLSSSRQQEQRQKRHQLKASDPIVQLADDKNPPINLLPHQIRYLDTTALPMFSPFFIHLPLFHRDQDRMGEKKTGSFDAYIQLSGREEGERKLEDNRMTEGGPGHEDDGALTGIKSDVSVHSEIKPLQRRGLRKKPLG